MAVPQVIEAIEQQAWPDQVGEVLEKAVSAFETDSPACRTIENILHGTWVGHPLHPILTDLPLGAWSTALVLDATDMARGTDDMGPARTAPSPSGWRERSPRPLPESWTGTRRTDGRGRWAWRTGS